MRRTLLALCLLLATLVAAGASAAEGESDPYSFQAAIEDATAAAPEPPAAPTLDPRDQAALDYQKSQDAGFLKIIFVVSGVAVAFLGFTAWLSSRPHSPLSGRDVLRAAVVTFIAYGGIVLALAYPRNETMTGVIGILSAIAGYVFGRSGREERGDDDPAPARGTRKA